MPASHELKIDKGDILIVDDEIPNLELLKQLLSKAGYKIRPTDSPQLALESALGHPPHLILLDVRMPEMDGFEVCRRLKQEERTRDIPIIFVSALQDVQDRVRGFEVGGVDFISKPFQEEEVLARVRNHMELRNMQLNLEKIVAKRTTEVIEREERFRATFEQAAVGVAHVSPDGKFLRLNQKFCDIVGYSQDEMLDLTFQDITHPEDLDTDLEYVRQVLAGEIENYSMDKRYYRKDGSIVWVNLSVSLLCDDKGNPKYFVSVIKDISERKQAEQKILDYQKRLKALASQLTIAEEKERRSIAADLHDQVGYSLALANMQLNEILEAESVLERTLLVKDISKILLKALQDTRSLIFELSSPSMNEIGLAAAISEWLEEQIAKRHDLKIEFNDAIDDNHRKTLDSNVRALLFRNVREMLTNVIKHSRAQNVRVQIISEGSCLKITVEDDGVGFNPDADNTKQKQAEGFGLFSIQERMADLGGSFDIQSHPGKGCRVTLISPPIVSKGKK